MPIHVLSSALSSVLALETYPVAIAVVFAIIFLKQWSGGLDLLSRLDRAASDPDEEIHDDKGGGIVIKKKKFKPRDLHGTVILVVGGFTSQGLLVCAQLSSLGAQLILLTSTLKSSRVLQMVHLLRDGTFNPLIYAEQCDITNMASVDAFTATWNLGQGNSGGMGGVGAGPAGASSASTGLGGISSMDGGKPNGGSSPRRVDSIVFMPLDSTHYSFGDKTRLTSEGLECSQAEILGRFHLINRLLPTLLLLPPHRDIRIVSLVSPWYAAGIETLDSHKEKSAISPGSINELLGKRKGAPWRRRGAQTLLWLSLSRELQRRIQLMTEADVRPRTKLPGIDDQGMTSSIKATNVNVINICAGFERGRDVLDFILPRSVDLATVEDWADDVEQEDSTGNTQSTIGKGDQSDRLRHLVNPGGRGPTESPATPMKKSKESLQRFLPEASLWTSFVSLVRISTVVAIWPLTWILCKGPKRAAETVTWANVVPILEAQSTQKQKAGLFVVPGEMHREGRPLRPALPAALLPGEQASQAWRAAEKQIKAVLGRSV